MTRLPLLGLVLLAGCSSLTKFTAEDAGMAYAMASNPAIQKIDTSAAARADCWDAAAKIATNATPPEGAKPGLAVGIETALETKALTNYGPCQLVGGQLIGLLTSSGGLPGLPGLLP